MDIYATNLAERAYSVVILYIALVALSSFIGSISASVTQLRNMSADESKSMWVLRRYLKQKRLSKSLTHRVIAYTEFQQDKKRNIIAPGQVKLLGMLSEQLTFEMALELSSKFIADHPLFQYMLQDDTFLKTMGNLCSNAFKPKAIAQSENLFHLGDEGKDMIFVKSGALAYTLPSGELLEGLLTSKLWAAEAVLWTSWRHRGWLKGTEPSDVLTLSPMAFSDIIQLHPKPAVLANKYGTDFVNYLNQQEFRYLTDVVFDAKIWVTVVKESDTVVMVKKADESSGAPNAESSAA
jgi:hypothetical protein